MFNKRRNEEREKMASPIETPQAPKNEAEAAEAEPVPVEHDEGHLHNSSGNGNGNGGSKLTNGNLKPSIISEGFEFIGEIRSNGYLTIDGIVRGTLSLHSIQIGATGVLDGNVTCDTMNVKGNFSGSLECRDLTIGSRAVVDGKVSFKSITIQRGGVVKGELKKKA